MKKKHIKSGDNYLHWHETFAIFIIIFSILLAVSLWTYNIDDLNSFPAKAPENKISVVGAFASHWLFQTIGVSAYLLPILLLIFSIFAFVRYNFKTIKFFFWKTGFLILFIISAACFCDIIHPNKLIYLNIPSAGGIFGLVINELIFINFFGKTGAIIIISGFIIIEFLLFFNISLRLPWMLLTKTIIFLGRLTLEIYKIVSYKLKQLFDLIILVINNLKSKINNKNKTKVKPIKSVIKIATVTKQSPTYKSPLPPTKQNLPPEKSEKNIMDDDEIMPAYQPPQPELLDDAEEKDIGELKSEAELSTKKLENTLKEFGVDASIGDVICGPVITCHEVHPASGVKVSRITSLENDIAMAMKAKSIRIIAPIPGKDAVGIEIPNKTRRLVTYSQLVHTKEYDSAAKKMTLPLALGQTIDGTAFVDDLAKMPHLLVAGATGSGKSVCINTILLSLLLKFSPDELKLILVDPKHVELVPYHKLPHLLVPVLNEADKVPDALEWLIEEMNRRYKYFAKFGVRNIASFNEKRKTDKRHEEIKVGAETRDVPESLPLIVLIIDELADLMMVAKGEVEERIIRLAQLARAAGIHMIIATQRPSTNVITGLIKANIPARIAFRTTSSIDSRVILDQLGSDKLLGMGDMLYKSPNLSSLQRIQGAFVSDDEVQKITDFIREQRPPNYVDLGITAAHQAGQEVFHDDKLDDAIRIVVGSGQASASYLQRSLRVGYARAASLIDMMEAKGIVGPKRGAKPRDILISAEDLPPLNNIL